MTRLTTRTVQASVAFCLILGLGGLAKAEVIYSDFGLGDTYTKTRGLAISGSSSFLQSTIIQGSSFTAVTGGTLSEIDVAFFNGASGSQKFNLGLYSDDGNGHLGGLIESIQNIGPAISGSSILSVSSAIHPVLMAGTDYWLVASPADSGSFVNWNLNSQGASGVIYSNLNGSITYGASTNIPVFRLIGAAAAVPEPSSLALCFIAGASGLTVAHVRRKRVGNGARTSGTSSSVKPQPAR